MVCAARQVHTGEPRAVRRQRLHRAVTRDEWADIAPLRNAVLAQLRALSDGEGLLDVPGLKLFGDIDPADLVQAPETY